MDNEKMMQEQPDMVQLPPDYAEFYAGGAEKLSELLEKLKQKEQLAGEIRTLAGDIRRLEKEINDEKKALETELSTRVSDEREQTIAAESKKITESNAAIRKTKNDRNKAKERGIKDRIEKETVAMVSENRDTHRYIRRTLKENGLPSYCDTGWFYTLFCTQGFLEWLIRILVYALGLVIIPGIVVKLVDPWFFLKFLLWVGVMVVFIAVYLTIFLLTKDKDNGTLGELREYRDRIHDNKKKITAVKKGIRSDTDESHYNLEEYDEKIADLEKVIEENTREKERKLREFDEVRKPQLINSIHEQHVPVIEDKQYIMGEKNKQAQEKNSELEIVNRTITEDYEKYLTKANTNPEAVQRMLQLMENNTAATIGQAMEMQRMSS